MLLVPSITEAQYPIYKASPKIYRNRMNYNRYNSGFGMGGMNINVIPPSPYYVTPTGQEYLDYIGRRDRTTYTEMMLNHRRKN